MKKLCKFAEIRRPNGTTFEVDYQDAVNWSADIVRVWEEDVTFPDAPKTK